jgi:hypothetical protein
MRIYPPPPSGTPLPRRTQGAWCSSARFDLHPPHLPRHLLPHAYSQVYWTEVNENPVEHKAVCDKLTSAFQVRFADPGIAALSPHLHCLLQASVQTTCGLRKIAKSGGPGAAAAASAREVQAKNISKGRAAALAVSAGVRAGRRHCLRQTVRAEQPCASYVGTYGSSKIASKEVRMTPTKTKGKALRKKRQAHR